MNGQSEHPISELKLERYVAGDLSGDEMDQIRQLAETDSGLLERITALEQSNREILEDRPPAWVARQIQIRADGVPNRRSRATTWKWLVPALPALAAAVFLMMKDPSADRPEWSGIKGLEAHLLLYRQSGETATRLQDGETARPGDRIQIVYNAAGKPFGFIFSVDGAGNLTKHLPEKTDRSAKLRTSGPDTLQYAYRLDDAPRYERFYLITGDQPFSLDSIQEKALAMSIRDSSRLQPLSLESDLSQDVLTLIKE